MCEYKNDKFELELSYYYDEMIDEYYTDDALGNENLRKMKISMWN